MSSNRILLIGSSATMRHVIKNQCEQSGYNIDILSSYTAALEQLNDRHEDRQYDCLVIDWPVTPLKDTEAFFERLKSPSFDQIPLILLSQDLHPSVRKWVASHPNALLLEWKEYYTLASNIDHMLERSAKTASDQSLNVLANRSSNVLIIDDSKKTRIALQDLLLSNGYNVSVATDAQDGLQKAVNGNYHLAIISYYLQGISSDSLCQRLANNPATKRLPYTIMADTYCDYVVKNSLAAGAVDCLFRQEADELIIAKIDAIGRMVHHHDQLNESYLRLDAILSAVKDGLYCVDKKGRLTFANARAKQLLSYPTNYSFEGAFAQELFHHSSANGTVISKENCPIHRAYGHGVSVNDMNSVFFDANKNRVKVRLSIRPLMVDNHANGSIVEFTSAEKDAFSDSKAWYRIAYENNAGVMNRQHFESCLSNTINRARRNNGNETLLVVNIEYSSNGSRPANISTRTPLVNAISRLLTQQFRNSDLIGYLGDGQFGLILSHTHIEDIFLVTGKFNDAIVTLSNKLKSSRLDFSGGLASIGSKSTFTASELIAKAQLGAQIAKRRGRNYVFYYDQNKIIPSTQGIAKNTYQTHPPRISQVS